MNLRILSRPPGPNDPSRVLMLLPSEGEATAEDLAMIQALYSRDPRPIDDSLKMLKSTKSGDFMNKFYVGYGHDSIAECGSVVVAVENVPMPVAKAIQHYQLYRGQECSTRYLDFSMQPFSSFTNEGEVYQKELRKFYLNAMEPTTRHITELFRMDVSIPENLKAARAAAFDVLRGYLPCGAQTNLSWTVDLRSLNSRIADLRTFQPMFPDIKPVVDKLASLMKEAFPNSYKEGAPEPPVFKKGCNPGVYTTAFKETAFVEWEGVIDFASWRDLQRHRSVVQTFPVISTDLGYEDFYVDMLPHELRTAAMILLDGAKDLSVKDLYAVPMAYRVPFNIVGPLDKFRYILKLRTSQSVHPTLRKKMIALGGCLSEKILVEYNSNPEWVVGRRGTQDIIRNDSRV